MHEKTGQPPRQPTAAVDYNTFFREVTRRISASLMLDEALCEVFDYLEQFMPMDTLGLHRFDEDKMGIFAVAEVARDGRTKIISDDMEVFPVDPALHALIRDMEASGRHVTIFNRGQALPESVIQCFPHMASRSVLSLSLYIQQERQGGLLLSAEGHDLYTPEHAALLESVKEPIALAMSNAWRYREMARLKDLLAEDNRELAMEMERASGVQVIGAEHGLSQVMDMVRRVAPLTSPVLLLGETGTGKEVIANAIHLMSPRNQKPIIRVQCGAIPESLLDSELFGHEKGAFTGAFERKRGRFERAEGGTIFLDEIGELTSEAQVRLLRVLQEKEFERVGGSQTLHTDVRIIAATHRDLLAMVREGRFREDLWYRLNVFPIHLPPLRLRKGDIPELARYFTERKAREMNFETVPRIQPDQLAHLLAYDWPGNVRELQNVIERALILTRGSSLLLPPLGPPPQPATPALTTPVKPSAVKTLDEVAAEHICSTLRLTNGRIAGPGGAAELLGLPPGTLRSRMKKLGIQGKQAFDNHPRHVPRT